MLSRYKHQAKSGSDRLADVDRNFLLEGSRLIRADSERQGFSAPHPPPRFTQPRSPTISAHHNVRPNFGHDSAATLRAEARRRPQVGVDVPSVQSRWLVGSIRDVKPDHNTECPSYLGRHVLAPSTKTGHVPYDAASGPTAPPHELTLPHTPISSTRFRLPENSGGKIRGTGRWRGSTDAT